MPRKAYQNLVHTHTASESASSGPKFHAFRFHLPRILTRSRTAPSLAPVAADGAVQRKPVSHLMANPSSREEADPSSRRHVHESDRSGTIISTVHSQRLALDDSVVPNMSRKLNTTLTSHDALRAFNGVHQGEPQPPQPPVKAPLLLPSPIASNGGDVAGHGYTPSFAFHNPRAVRRQRTEPVKDTWEYDDIVAAYYRESFGASKPASQAAAAAAIQLPSNTQPSTPEPGRPPVPSPPMSNMSTTFRSPKRDRSSSLSSEATWLSKGFAHQHHTAFIGQLETIQMNEKRLGETSRRCCQVVESADDGQPGGWIGERKASYATVIKPGKANELWVPRSGSSNLPGRRDRNPSKCSKEPTTPEGRIPEVSAFSPWETPGRSSISTGVREEIQEQMRQLTAMANIRHSSSESLVPRGPLSSPNKPPPDTASDGSACSLSSSRSSSTLTSEHTDRGSEPHSPGSTPEIPTVDRTSQSRWANLATTLDALEQTIDEYPSSLCQLDSAWTLRIRDANSLDELHIDRLLQIFPLSSRRDLSALAAMLIAQSFLTGLPAITQPSAPCRPSPLTDHTNRLVLDVSNRASTALGIRPLDLHSDQPCERWLKKRAKIIEAALHGMVQKLMVSICGKYDELLWRALVCLVETVEHGC